MWAPLKKLKIGLRVKFSDQRLRTFRFLLGALISYDLIVHFSDLALFYTDSGIFPRAYAAASVPASWWSIYSLSGSFSVTAVLYAIHLLIALAFMAGIGFPFITPLLWIFQFSLRNRNVAIMDGSDDLSVVLVFFAMWLPLTQRLQQDARGFFQRWVHQPMWNLALIIQVMCLYSFSALQKYDASWNSSFTAISLALRLDILVNPFGQWLLQYPNLLKAMTAFVYHLELWGPMIYLLAAFVPHRKAIRVQQAVCILFISFHLGLSATMRLGVFAYYCVAAWMLLFPSVSDLESEETEINAQPFLRTQIASLAISVFTLITVLTMNARAVQGDALVAAPVRWFANHFSLHQNWGMFAPFPALDNYHIVTTALYSDGSMRAIENEPFWLENRHRVKYWLNMDLKRRDFLAPYALYQCRRHSTMKVMAPLLVKTKVTTLSRIATKEDASKETRFSRDIWIQPCL